MCNCMTMCWEPDVITENGRWPLPKYHPNCEDYKAEKFIVFISDGIRCVVTPDDAEDMIKDTDNGGIETYQVEEVFISQDQFDNLKEFEGF